MIRIPVWQYCQTSEIKAARWDFNASGDSTWRHKSRSNLAQVMACCLMAPSHNLNHRWIIIKGVLWHSSESNFPNARGICSDIALLMTISQGPNFTALVSQLDFTRYPMQFNVWLMLLYHTWVWNRGICMCVIMRPRSHMLIVLKKGNPWYNKIWLCLNVTIWSSQICFSVIFIHFVMIQNIWEKNCTYSHFFQSPVTASAYFWSALKAC